MRATNAGWLVVVALAGACRDRPAAGPAGEGAGTAASAAPVVAPAPSPARDAGASVSTPGPSADVRAAAEALLAGWRAAQNAGDFARYAAFYADTFRGVRRSGARTVRLDRVGWMKDRARMFRKPMAVEVEGVLVAELRGALSVSFTQAFEQGAFRDRGRKVLLLEGPPDALRIRREEMLDSSLLVPRRAAVPPAAPVPPLGDLEVRFGVAGGRRDRVYLAPVRDGELLLAETGGGLGIGPITVLGYTIDSAAGTMGGVTAERAIDPARLPPPLAGRVGAAIQVLDRQLQPRCRPTIARYRLRVAAWAAPDAADAEAAAADLMAGTVMVVAELDGLSDACRRDAAFARDVDLPALPTPGTVPAAADRAAREDEGEADVDGVAVAGGADGAVFAFHRHTPDACDTQESFATALWLARLMGDEWIVTPLVDYAQQDELLAVVDADGDGVLDVFTRRGVHRDGASAFWDPDLRLFWPAGLGCDGCDGDDC